MQNLRRCLMTIDYQRYIVRDPSVCGGEPVVKGTRVTLRTILASLAEGMSVAEIVEDFPTLNEAAVRAVIAFAAVSAEEDLPIPPHLHLHESEARREHSPSGCWDTGEIR